MSRRRVRVAAACIAVAAVAGACSSSSNGDSSTAFGRTCRALGDANTAMFRDKDFAKARVDYAKVGKEAPNITDSRLRAAATKIAAKAASSRANITLVGATGSDPNDRLLRAACVRRYGAGY